jgi:hypothetical protein
VLGGPAWRARAPHPYDATVLRALWNLLILGWKTRFRVNGAYWAWRRETGFGTDAAHMPNAAARRHAMLEYGAWVGQMRALRRR